MGAWTSTEEQAAKTVSEIRESAERRDRISKQIIEAERAAAAAKTKRLRALRLAKEAADSKSAQSDKAENNIVPADRCL